MKLRFLLILSALTALIRPAAAEFYSIPWTNDATAGFSTTNAVWAYNFGTTTGVPVNGVSFPHIPGITPSVANRFALTGMTNGAGDANSLTSGGGGSATLAAEFLYGGNPATITLSGLNAGQVYSLHVYSTGFGAGSRNATWASGSESAVLDQHRFGDNEGVRITYSFSARNSTKTITITPATSASWHFCAIALTHGPTYAPIVPTISASSPAAAGFPVENAVNGNYTGYKSTAGDSTFLEFDFGSPRTVDTFVNVTNLDANATNRLDKSRLIFDTDGTVGFNAATDTVVIFTEANTGYGEEGYINRFPPVTAQKARWEVVKPLMGAPIVGTIEMTFLQTVTGAAFVPPGTVSAGWPALNAQFALQYAWDGKVGLGNVNKIEYASVGAGASMFAEFDLGSNLPVTGFDFFDRIQVIDQIASFEVSFWNAAGTEIPGTLKNYTKSSWLRSDHFSPITCRKVKLKATATSSNGFSGVGDFVIYRDNPVLDITFGNVAASAIDSEMAAIGGTVTTVGAAPITERGVVFSRTSENANPELGGVGVIKVAASGTTGAFSVDLDFLTLGTGYTYRVYASDSGGVVYSYSPPQTFTTLGGPPPVFSSLSDVGLWIGEVVLNEVVSEATTPVAWQLTPAPFRHSIIMHVDAAGVAKLLPEATLMRTLDTALPVIVTNSRLLSNFGGITLRGGKLVGQRFSASNFPPPAAGSPLSSTTDGAINAEITMAPGHPLNPFRHKYHPDLANGRALTHRTKIFTSPSDPRSDNVWSGIIYESVAGLNKNHLSTRGTVTFTRVSTVGKLNQP